MAGSVQAAPPLIVTLTLDAAAQARFDALRRAHFPPDRLVVGAHVTLFHALPGEELAAIAAALRDAAESRFRFPVTVAAVRFLGRGVAFNLHSPALLALRDALRQRWETWLTAQDRQRWQPHVTIQNKVDAATARALHAQISRDFVPHAVTAMGLALWHYRHPGWKAASAHPFRTEN